MKKFMLALPLVAAVLVAGCNKQAAPVDETMVEEDLGLEDEELMEDEELLEEDAELMEEELSEEEAAMEEEEIAE